MSAPFTEAGGLPVNSARPVVTFSPVTSTVPDRPVPLEIKVSAPVTGDNLPVIVFSHGHGSSNSCPRTGATSRSWSSGPRMASLSCSPPTSTSPAWACGTPKPAGRCSGDPRDGTELDLRDERILAGVSPTRRNLENPARAQERSRLTPVRQMLE